MSRAPCVWIYTQTSRASSRSAWAIFKVSQREAGVGPDGGEGGGGVASSFGETSGLCLKGGREKERHRSRGETPSCLDRSAPVSSPLFTRAARAVWVECRLNTPSGEADGVT